MALTLNKGAEKKLLQDCFILLVSLVLTEPATTPQQRKLIAKLIKRLKAHVTP